LLPESAVEVFVVQRSRSMRSLDDLGIQVLVDEAAHFGPEGVTL
jgi:hypothetical protein